MVTPVERRSSKTGGQNLVGGKKRSSVRRSLEFHDAHCGSDDADDMNKIFTDEEIIQINTPDVDNDDDNDDNYKTVLESEKDHNIDNDKGEDKDNSNDICASNNQHGDKVTDEGKGPGIQSARHSVDTVKASTAPVTLLKTPKPTTEFTGVILIHFVHIYFLPLR